MNLRDFALGKAAGGGGGEATLINKNVSANGTYNASSDSADGYKKVVVDVPNSYGAGDEGKVVSNGGLVAQTSATKTENGTYDTTLNNSVTVNVPSPTGNINITDTSRTNVSAYATAQVVDADLVAGNIKKDVNILGITGTYEGGGGGGDALFCSLIDGTIAGVVVPDGVTSLRSYAFANCTEITSVVLPASVATIGTNCFSKCIKLKSVNIPQSVTVVPNSCFIQCSELESIDIPSGVTKVDVNAFRSCDKLKSVTVRATTPPTLGGSAFTYCDALTDIYVPSASVDTYKSASGWSSYASIIKAIPE